MKRQYRQSGKEGSNFWDQLDQDIDEIGKRAKNNLKKYETGNNPSYYVPYHPKKPIKLALTNRTPTKQPQQTPITLANLPKRTELFKTKHQE